MIYDLQKASLLKRLSAFILDAILLLVLVVGIAALLSGLLGYDNYSQTMNECYTKYEAQFGISFETTQEEYDALPAEEQQKIDAAYEALNADEEAVYCYNMIVNLSLLIVSLSIFLSFLALEFVVPLLFGNGQTVGKRVFSLGLMKTNGIKVNPVSLFVRTVLGKFAIGTMIPLLMIMMMLLGTIGILGPIVVIGIVLIQLVMMITSHTNGMIHDALAQTVVVDIHSQMIFGSESELMEYKKRAHEEFVSKQTY